MQTTGTGPRRWLRILLGLAAVAWLVLACRPAEAAPIKFAQPFYMRFSRSDVQVIALLSGHPTYQAVEVFHVPRPGREPLVRAVLTRLDGVQIDHVNDLDFVIEVTQTVPGRLAVYEDVHFEETLLPGGIPHVVVQFTSYRGEDIVLDFTALFPPSPAEGGLVNPGNHSSTESLPILWSEASALGSTETTVLIDGSPQPLVPGPFPGAVLAIYSAGFYTGVIRAGGLDLDLIDGPTHLCAGQAWTFVDQIGRTHRYEIISVEGDLVLIRKTTLDEEIILAKAGPRRKDPLQILRVRLTGLPASANATPPAPSGLTLDLTTPGQFTLSIDEHNNLVSGVATSSYDGDHVAWTLAPTQPEWAIPRVVNVMVDFDRRGDVVFETTVGAP